LTLAGYTHSARLSGKTNRPEPPHLLIFKCIPTPAIHYEKNIFSVFTPAVPGRTGPGTVMRLSGLPLVKSKMGSIGGWHFRLHPAIRKIAGKNMQGQRR
jgi:hypothetical protein